MSAASAQPALSQDPIQVIKDAIVSYQNTTHAPGVCVSIIDLNYPALNDGKVVAAGVQDLLTAQLVTPDTVFQIGSETKLFTSLLTAYAVVEGNCQLSDRAIDWLLLYKNVSNDAVFSSITLLELATHTSGMPDMPDGMGGVSDQLFNDQPPSERLYNYWNHYKTAAALTPCWLYSDIGFVTLGFCVSALFKAQKPLSNHYNELMRTLITGPMGMPNTGAHPAGGMALGYGYKKNPVTGQFENVPAPGVAADLKSTGTDMLTFLKVSLGLEDSTLPATLKSAITMTQTMQGTYPICGKPNSMNMGLGWQMPTAGGAQMYYKNGATGLGGQSCAIELIPSRQFGVSVLTNQCPNEEVKGGPTVLATKIREALTGLTSDS